MHCHLIHLKDVLHALDVPASPLLSRLIAVIALTTAFLLHGTQLRNAGLRVQNALGVFTLATLYFIAMVGVISAIKKIGSGPGDGGVEVDEGELIVASSWWEYIWAGTRFDANSFVTALYNVIWCVIQYAR